MELWKAIDPSFKPNSFMNHGSPGAPAQSVKPVIPVSSQSAVSQCNSFSRRGQCSQSDTIQHDDGVVVEHRLALHTHHHHPHGALEQSYARAAPAPLMHQQGKGRRGRRRKATHTQPAHPHAPERGRPTNSRSDWSVPAPVPNIPARSPCTPPRPYRQGVDELGAGGDAHLQLWLPHLLHLIVQHGACPAPPVAAAQARKRAHHAPAQGRLGWIRR